MTDDLTIHTNYRDDEIMRNRFFDFVEEVFSSVDFRTWHRMGHWSDAYMPFSIVDGDRIVSNVSATRMTLLIEDRLVNGIQIGTVGTIAEFQNRGLSRLLMEHVLSQYEPSVDIIFLFANDSVLDFYPKFGFTKYPDCVFISDSYIPAKSNHIRKLDFRQENDSIILQRLLDSRLPLTKIFGASNYNFITWWHIINGFSDHLYYSPDDEVICIATRKKNELHLWDIIHSQAIDPGEVIPKIVADKQIETIHYHFPPDQTHYKYDRTEIDHNSHLFVKGIFNLDGRSFKFPVTAET